MAKSRKGACGRTTKKSRKGGKGKGACGKEFASSMKAKLFIKEQMKRKSVETVGGINGVLGCRLADSGIGTAKKLSGKVMGMTKRKYLRFMMKKSGSNIRYAMDSYLSLKKHCDKVKDCKGGRRKRRPAGGSRC